MCGGDLEVAENMRVAECEYCGTQQTLPRLDDERKANLYDRAGHFRRNNEFDKAISIYEKILEEDRTDAEAYWSLVLCKYGIEYVEDPSTHKRVPTVNRAQYTSVFADADYKAAIEYADVYQRSIYEAEAKAIDDIQKGILEISNKEEPFDVFICYKETDNNGRRTPDSVLANDLYHQLTNEGFKVFFSRITLEDKLGTAYEPYIFAALNSAKVMVVLGTKPEYFNAVWVKNEWSRYLALIKNGAKKMLIPAYRDMDPYDLPEEFSHLQAQDMSKLGFMQDLIRGIKKIIGTNAPKVPVKETVVVNSGNANTAPLLKRAFMFLEDGNWQEADEYCEKVLDQDPENARAYLGKLMAAVHAHKKENLRDCKEPFEDFINYKKVLRFAEPALAEELKGYITYIKERNKTDVYNGAVSAMKSAATEKAYKAAASAFKSIPGFKDADALAEQCLDKAEACRKDVVYASAKVIYDSAKGNKAGEHYEEALKAFQSISGWKDADEQINNCRKKIEEIKAKEEAEAERIRHQTAKASSLIAAGEDYAVGLNTDGTVDAVGDNIDGQRNVSGWRDIAAITTGWNHTVGLKSDGTAVAVGRNDYDQCEITGWRDITAIAAGRYHTVGLKKDGTVIAVGDNDSGQCNVSKWRDITAIAAGCYHTVGLKKDGTVIAVGDNDSGQCNVSKWRGIIAVSAGQYHTVGLKSDGTVVAVGNGQFGQCNVSGWRDIAAITTGWNHTVGLKSDGTAVAVGRNDDGQCEVSRWHDIIAIAAGASHTVGLKSYGTVVAVGRNYQHQCNVSDFKLFNNFNKIDEERVTARKRLQAECLEAERKAEERRIAAKKIKRVTAIAAPIVVLVIAFLIVLKTVIIPASKYNSAMELYNAGNYKDAYEAFNAMSYKDSKDKATDCQYNSAMELYNAGNYKDAYEAFNALSYKDSKDKAMECLFLPQKENLSGIKKGDTFKFGYYEQDNNTENGKEEIEWLVLEVEGNKAFVISKYALDCQPYNTTDTGVTWEYCTLRIWLNNSFYNTAFNSLHQALIETVSVSADKNPRFDTNPGNATNDKVFLLSYSEVKNIGSPLMQCQGTAYCNAKGAYTDEKGIFRWLRSPGENQNYAACFNNRTLYAGGGLVYRVDIAVRPTLWINIGA